MNISKLATTIGSLPYQDPKTACKLIMDYTPQLPAWPQLPKRCFKENMYAQFSENFPGIIVDEHNQKIFVSENKALIELEKFYEHYLEDDIDYFQISPEYAQGLYEFFSVLCSRSFSGSAIKGQVTGPVTFGLSVKNEQNKPIFYNNDFRDVVIKNCIMKSKWQIKKFHSLSRNFVIFLDEPYLSAYGSAFTAISREDIVNSIQEVVRGLKKEKNLLIGVHCCANTDWSILLDTDIDILSFDAYEFFDNLVLYIDKLRTFLDKGKYLAWGIVPTKEDLIDKETASNLIDRYEQNLNKLIKHKLDKTKLISQSIFTPACGLGSLTDETKAQNALELLSKISKNILNSA